MLGKFPLNRRSIIAVSLRPLRELDIKLDPEIYLRAPASKIFLGPQDNAETAVVHLAGFVIPFLGWRIKIVREEFPDAIYESPDGSEIRVEFEVKSSNFIEHGHAASLCDCIICWEDDLNTVKREVLLAQNPNLIVLELRRFFHDYEVSITL